ncbi:CLUMA_CG010254, isoform A [Clunio marinus]|uniref:CLUMA_CG010254, isoform A n=1 Tax=Clunio marinus TaxID=568069 RepID=A0A1J1I8I1_9DIPT|nr:CLUMA_CG010254, isoform A [Clunio marinus]
MSRKKHFVVNIPTLAIRHKRPFAVISFDHEVNVTSFIDAEEKVELRHQECFQSHQNAFLASKNIKCLKL